MLHVNPKLKNKGMLVVFNPLDKPVEQTIHVNLYYTGLTDTATIRPEEGEPKPYKLDRTFHVNVPVKVGPQAMTWMVIQ